MGLGAAYALTGVFTRMPNEVLMEQGNGLISTMEHDMVTLKINRIEVAAGKGRAAMFRKQPTT